MLITTIGMNLLNVFVFIKNSLEFILSKNQTIIFLSFIHFLLSPRCLIKMNYHISPMNYEIKPMFTQIIIDLTLLKPQATEKSATKSKPTPTLKHQLRNRQLPHQKHQHQQHQRQIKNLKKYSHTFSQSNDYNRRQ